jgi:lipopolysaccharide transport system ATP-binding protein
MSADEVERKMPEIEAFAEIGDYVDQPVRVYSSGMQVRLAFSVATVLRPDILIVDEALAVGDVFFQQKCLERIRQFLREGTTLLFVSHSAATVYSLCDRAIMIDDGRITLDGAVREVIDLYNATVAARASTGRHPLVIGGAAGAAGAAGGAAEAASEGDVDGGVDRGADRGAASTAEGAQSSMTVGSYRSAGADIESVELVCDGVPAHSIISGSAVALRVTVRFHQAFDDPHLGFQLRDRRGEAVFMTHTHAMRQKIGPVEAGGEVSVEYRFNVTLAPGDYTLSTGLGNGGLDSGALADAIARAQDAIAFQVVADLDDIQWDGLCNLRPEVGIMRPGKPTATGEGLLVTTSHSLLWLDAATGRSCPVHRGAGLYYGMASDARYVYVGARRRMVSSPAPQTGERGAILAFDHQLTLQHTWEAPFPLRDIHEIALHDGVLWVTCAFDNMVATRDADGHWRAWYPLGEPDGAHRDVNHFNSIAFTPGKIHLLAHNRGASERIEFSLPERRLLAREPLGQQAHNLWQTPSGWATCSSGEGRLVGDDGLAVHTGRFPRGIAFLRGGGAAVGVSELAERQHRDLTSGAVLLFDAHWNLQTQWSLPGEGLVLDIKPCP